MAEIDKEKLRRAIVNRGMVVPVVEYDDGSQGWGVPGLIMEPIEAWQRLQAGAGENVARMQRGLPFDPQAAGDAFAVTGAAAMGSVAAPKPSGAYVTSGAPMKKVSEPKGITAYHGSPYDFDRFDISKMGSGEGAQAYGPGLYFAEAEDVARNYRDNLQPMASQARDNPDNLMRTAFSVGRDAAGALQYLESEWRKWGYDRPQNDLQTYRAAAMREAIERIKGGETAAKNRKTMYEVRINADPEDFLDWDAPWASQPAAVQRAMREAGVHPERSGPFGTKEIPDTPISISAERALKDPQHMIHETLKEQSVPGIKYLDQGSRAAGEGSRNYVVFDDKLIDIVKKYGIVGAASLYGVSELELMEAMQERGL